MKTLKLFSLILFASTIFISCGKDENTGTPKQVNTTYTFQGVLKNLEGVNGEISFNAITLSDIIGAEAASNFKSGEMQLASCSIEIDGLDNVEMPEGEIATLNNFTITVGTNTPVLLGNCKVEPSLANEFASDVKQSTNKFISVIETIFSDITSGNKSTVLKVSFSPNVDITTSSNVSIKITIGGTYQYVVYE